MPKFFAEHKNIGETAIHITGSDANHIARVLRHQIGDKITVCDGAGADYLCEIVTLCPECV